MRPMGMKVRDTGDPSGWEERLPFEEQFRFVDVDIVVRTNSERFRKWMSHLYEYFHTEDVRTPVLVFSAVESDDGFSVYEHGDLLCRGEEFAALVFLERWMANAALERLERFYQLHAGAVSRDGRGLVFPAPPGCGKSTLVFGLLTRGFRYLSDDVVLFDTEMLHAIPFPRSLGIKGTTRDLVMRLCPHLSLDDPTFPHKADPWYLSPEDVLAEPWGGICPVEYIIFPRYDPTRPYGLIEIGRAQAAAELVRLSFNFFQHRERGLDVAAHLVRRARCYRLSVNRLEDATSMILDLMA